MKHSDMAFVEYVVIAIWAMLPAYIPNNVAVVAGGGPPIDGGRTWREKRILGDGKTWRGTAFGVGAGLIVAAILTLLADDVSTLLSISLPTFPVLGAVGLAVGAMLGDIVGSLIKRRLGHDRGAMVPGVDQLDFVVVSLPLTAVLATEWFRDVFTSEVIVIVLVLTPLLHLGTNGIAYVLGLKDEPW